MRLPLSNSELSYEMTCRKTRADAAARYELACIFTTGEQKMLPYGSRQLGNGRVCRKSRNQLTGCSFFRASMTLLMSETRVNGF